MEIRVKVSPTEDLILTANFSDPLFNQAILVTHDDKGNVQSRKAMNQQEFFETLLSVVPDFAEQLSESWYVQEVTV